MRTPHNFYEPTDRQDTDREKAARRYLKAVASSEDEDAPRHKKESSSQEDPQRSGRYEQIKARVADRLRMQGARQLPLQL